MLTEEQRQKALAMIEQPSIASQLPVIYPGTKARWEEIVAHCSCCDQELPPESLRGTLTRVGGMVDMDAIGVCHDCKRITPCHYRLYPEYITGIVNGRWVMIHGRRTPRGWLAYLGDKVWKLLDRLGLYNRTKPPK